MKIFWSTFIHSLQLPKKTAVFYLNRIGMDIAVIYMFILLAIVSIPALIEQLNVDSGMSVQVNTFFLLIYFFIFYYLVLNVMIFTILSLIAYIGTIIARLTHRKLRYSILWKIAAFSTTIPLLLYTIIAFFYPLSNLFLIGSTIFIFFLLTKIIFIYPKRRHLK